MRREIKANDDFTIIYMMSVIYTHKQLCLKIDNLQIDYCL
jgi:hypothetical protein